MAVIVVLPSLWSVVANPFVSGALLIVAIEVSEEVHVTTAVMSFAVLSEYVPMAVYCIVVPNVATRSAGVTLIDTRATEGTVMPVEPEIFPADAVIVVVPPESAVASPFVPAVLLIVETDWSEELHLTDKVRSWVELSEKVPVALNCCVNPLSTVGLAGVTLRETSAAAVTVSEVEPETAPEEAVIVVVPADREPAEPLEVTSLLITAILGSDELQVTDKVRSLVELSEKVPVALNCCEVPSAILGFTGVTLMETRVTAVTVSDVEPETVPDVAVIEVAPTAWEVADPFELLSLLMVATEVSEELQMTDAVRSCMVLSEKRPVALNCCKLPSAMLGFAGDTSIEIKVAPVTVSEVEPDMPP